MRQRTKCAHMVLQRLPGLVRRSRHPLNTSACDGPQQRARRNPRGARLTPRETLQQCRHHCVRNRTRERPSGRSQRSLRLRSPAMNRALLCALVLAPPSPAVARLQATRARPERRRRPQPAVGRGRPLAVLAHLVHPRQAYHACASAVRLVSASCNSALQCQPGQHSPQIYLVVRLPNRLLPLRTSESAWRPAPESSHSFEGHH
mmetsp:Transcript_96767/g.185713  ORF Transcript_96767/g.185713 Transcript_96767/m.185713 type:complete len:204 (-) Transcript_96767:1472-2083(-)